MFLVISGRVTRDVGLEAGRLSKKFQAAIAQMLEETGIKSHISSIVLFPTILNPQLASLPDHVTYKKDGSIFVALAISHTRWVPASSEERIDLLAENLIGSINKIKETRLDVRDRLNLLRLVETAKRNLKSTVSD